MRIFNVYGERLDGPDNQTRKTQELFFNNFTLMEITEIDTCLEIMQLREKCFDSPPSLSITLKTRTDALKQHAPSLLLNTNLISHPLYTQSAFRFGDYYGHIALFPLHPAMSAKTDQVPSAAPPDPARRLANHSLPKRASGLRSQNPARHVAGASSNRGCKRRLGRSHHAPSDHRHARVSPAGQLFARTSRVLGRSYGARSRGGVGCASAVGEHQ